MPTPHAELRALLFGLAPYQRKSAPEAALLGDLAPALPTRHVKQALFIVGTAAFVPLEVRAAVLARALDPDLLPRFGREVSEIFARQPALLRLLPLERLNRANLEAALDACYDHCRRAELAAELAGRGATAAQDLLRRELERAVEGLGKEWWAPGVCVGLLPRLRGALGDRLSDALLENAQRVEDPSERAEILAAALPMLTGLDRQRAEDAAEASARAEPGPAKRAWALLWLADRAQDPAHRSMLLVEALALARLDEKEDPRRLIAALALRASRPERAEFLREARRPFEEGRISWPSADVSLAHAYVEAARTLPPELGGALAEEVHELRIPGEELIDERLVDLAPYLSPRQLEDALTAAVGSGRRYAPWADPRSAFKALAPYLSKHQLSTAIERIGQLPAGEAQDAAAMIADLASVLPVELALAAAPIASSLSNAWWSSRALAALQERLPEAARRENAARADATSPARLRALLGQLSTAEQDEILWNLLGRLWDRCAGGAPPPDQGDQAIKAEQQPTVLLPAPRTQKTAAPEPTAAPASQPPGLRWRRLLGRLGRAPLVHTAAPEGKVVSTGFAAAEAAGEPLPPELPLPPGAECLFWLEIGEPVRGAIDTAPASIPTDLLPERPRLKVALFGFPGEIGVREGADLGEIEVLPDGNGRVLQAALRPPLTDRSLLDRRLFFPVSIPPRKGTFRLRCNIYCQQVLVQSHLVTVKVASRYGWLRGSRWLARPWSTARLRTTVDYTLSHSLREPGVQEIKPHRLSLMLNSNSDGSVGFRFFGSDGKDFKRDAAIPELELQDLVERARSAMRTSGWGRSTPWQGERYRYEDGFDIDRLKGDLLLFARWGYRFYDVLGGRLAGAGRASAADRRQAVKRLHELMRLPGFVQVASKLSARHVLPLAMIYDRPLDSTLSAGDYTLCPAFEEALRESAPLWDMSCFTGECPSNGQDRVICPGGFWGFRHAIGMPVSIGPEGELAPRIEYHGAPGLAVAVSTDPKLERRTDHEQKLRNVFSNSAWQYADTRDGVIKLMRESHAHVLYFYCHGGLEAAEERKTPFIQVGPLTERGITRDLLLAKDIFWERPQPLVFINGCHTTALEPEQALDLVTAFVETSNAAGVIGTEITVFEPLACAFAEECLARFVDGQPIGEAVRKARLKLLHGGNPLGLVYIPFVVAHLRLVGARD